jgi:NADPH-dependent ferric siderophore reductase
MYRGPVASTGPRPYPSQEDYVNAPQPQATRVRPRPNFRTVQVTRIDRLTPHLTRVTVAGPELEGYASNGPAEHIRVWFPQAGKDKPLLPEWTEHGPVMPDGEERPVSRVYTPGRYDPRAQSLEIDFVIHDEGEGPGADWITNAAVGNTVTVTGPGGPYRGAAEASEFLLAGDHTALPAIATILDTLPAEARARVYVEVGAEAEKLPLASEAQVSVNWIIDGDSHPAGKALASALREVELPSDGGRVFVACEAGVMRDIRRHLLYERGLPKERLHSHGYWKHGEANHPDHDLGTDV